MDTPGESQVTMQFRAAPGTANQAVVPGRQTNDELVIVGANGTLTLTDVRFVINEFELEKADGACHNEDDDGSEDDSECEEVEGPAVFVDLPLNGDAAVALTDMIAVGTYRELEIEVGDLDFDEDDEPVDTSLRDAILAAYPSWPEDASMVMVGTFTPADGGPARPFIVFAEAEIEIELEFNPALVVDEDGSSEAVTITIDPMLWLMRGDDVLDLSAFDYHNEDDLLEFELEMENGFADVEWDD